MVYAENEGEVFLGRSVTKTTHVSEATMQKVDSEIRKIIDEQYKRARQILEENRDKVEAMAKALLDWETIDADQINDIMEGRSPRPPQAPPTPVDTAAPPSAGPTPDAKGNNPAEAV
jgi:cell division protease FtsH